MGSSILKYRPFMELGGWSRVGIVKCESQRTGRGRRFISEKRLGGVMTLRTAGRVGQVQCGEESNKTALNNKEKKKTTRSRSILI